MANRFHITPTQAARAAGCIHSWSLECYGDAAEKVDPDAGTLRLIEAGQAWERRCLESLDGAVEVPWDHKDWGAGQDATEALMKQGVRWIYQPALARDDVRGVPDFLRRARGRSRVGGWSYEPVDVKSHKQVSTRDRTQLRVCAWLMEPLLGRRPRRGGIWLSTGNIAPVVLGVPVALLDDMRRVRDARMPTEAVRCGECGRCPWIEHCRSQWEAARHSTLVYGATGRLARRITEAGLFTYDDVAALTPGRLARRLEIDRGKAAALHRGARAWSLGRPVPVSRPRWPDTPAVHFYDVETLGQAVYLHGLVTLHADGRIEERQTVARTLDDERRAWHELLGVVAALPDGPIYSWTDYERGHVEGLWSRHQGSARGYRRLTRDLEDMCALVRTHYALPASSYGLKEVAPLFGFAWRAEDAGGLAAGTWYEDWLTGGDDALLRKILEYNLDDVRAMAVVYRALRGVA